MYENQKPGWEAPSPGQLQAREEYNDSEVKAKFADHCREQGLQLNESDIIGDGKIHRCGTETHPQGKNGSYLLHLDGAVPAGWCRAWDKGEGETWHLDLGRRLTAAEQEHLRRQREIDTLQRKQETEARHKEAADRAKVLWGKARNATAEHPYLQRKGILPYDTKTCDDGALLVPLYGFDDDKNAVLVNLQRIFPNGDKRFLPGGKIKGVFWFNEDLTDASRIVVCEGFATAASIAEATGYQVFAAMSCHNLRTVAEVVKNAWPNKTLIIAADNDRRTKGNPGLGYAQEAARAVGALLAVPSFEEDEVGSDFNDLATLRGKDAVKSAIETAPLVPEEPWAELHDLTEDEKPWPYPVDALPGIIREAVEEVARYSQAPLAMVGSSALATCAAASQHLVDVERAPMLRGPVSLYFLTIAESGERKSTVDGYFSQPIRRYEALEAERNRGTMLDYKAREASWQEQKRAILERLRMARRKSDFGKVKSEEADLQAHEANEPERPRVPRLLITEESSENLGWILARDWPSMALLCAEGGLVLGGHAMQRDQVTRNISMYDALWSGESIHVGRRTSESYTIEGARLSVHLQVQPGVWQRFLEQSGDLARKTGMLARFLVSQPASTIGSRPYREPPVSWPALERLQNRIIELLDQKPNLDRGRLRPEVRKLQGEALREWQKVHDVFESDMAKGKDLEHLRDTGSKAAEQVARLAAVLALVDRCPEVGVAHVQGAARVVAWHGHEASRLFRGRTPLTAAALELEGFLIRRRHDKGETSCRITTVQQCGPGRLREGSRLRPVLDRLIAAGRVRIVETPHGKMVELRPELVDHVAS